MLSAFFVAHFFNEVREGYVGGKDLAVQMLEELLLNCLIWKIVRLISID